MERVTFQDPRVVNKVNGNYVPVRLEVAENQAFFNRFGEGAAPLVVFMRPDGSVVNKVAGYSPPDAFLKTFP